MGSLLNFIIPLETQEQYPEWCIPGPMTYKVIDNYSYTIFPNIREGYKNFLLIEPTHSMDGLTRKFRALNKIYNGKKFIKDNNIKLIVASIADAPAEWSYEQLKKRLDEYDLFDDTLVIVTNKNLSGKNLYSFHFFIEDGIKNLNTMFGLDNELGYRSEEIKIDELNNFRNKKFLSLNRTIDKQHRFSLLHDYIENDFSDSYFSFLTLEGIHCSPYQSNVFEIDEYKKHIPIELDTSGNFNFTVNTTMRKDLFLDSCINLVTETFFDENRLFLTEKLIKPIVNYQPFIIFGSPNYLKELKKLGFKTFSEFWDESYDNIEDPKERYMKLRDVLLELNAKSIHELNDIYQSTKEICIFNKEHFENMKLNDIDLFFENLKNE